MTAQLSRITLYPFKSLDGLEVQASKLLPGGALQYDREYALVDQNGKFIHAKSTSRIHAIRSSFDLEKQTITLGTNEYSYSTTFHLHTGIQQIEAWFSDFFSEIVKVQRNSHGGFPDDTTSPGPTLISTSSLEHIQSWFPEISLTELRRRFRCNLELNQTPPFWEDQLFTEKGQALKFKIGTVSLFGINPCQRCVVPSRDSMTGTVTPDFQKKFAEKRRQDMPSWAELSQFNHTYRVSINSRLDPETQGDTLKLGDTVHRDGSKCPIN